MNRVGVRVAVDYLGENVTNREDALRSEARYHQLLDEIARRKLDANVSLKLTHLGLDVDESLARRTVEGAAANTPSPSAAFIRVDMEGSAYTQRTLDLVRELHRRPGAAGHIGTVLQAYLYRTEEDARLLCAEGIRIRLCKGAYQEPAAIAYPEQAGCGRQLSAGGEADALGSGLFHGLATHDEKIIGAMQEWTCAGRHPKDGVRIPNAARSAARPAGESGASRMGRALLYAVRHGVVSVLYAAAGGASGERAGSW